MAREYYDGKDTYLIYAPETAYGTNGGSAPAVGSNFGRVQSVTLNMNQQLIRSKGIADGINQSSVVLGNFEVTGSVSTKPDDFTFLRFAGGRVTGAEGDTGDPFYLEEVANIGYPAGDDLSVTGEFELGNKGASVDQTKLVQGVVISRWTLSGQQGDELLCDFDFQGNTVTRGTSLETWAPLTTQTFTFNSGSVVWGASDTLDIVNFSVTCECNPVFPREAFSRFVKQPTLGTRVYNWTMTLNMHYDNTAGVRSVTELLDDFFDGTNSPQSSGIVTSNALTITINQGAANGDKVLVIQLENSHINDWSESPANEGGQVQVTINGFSLAGLTRSSEKEPLKWWTIG